MEFLYLNLFAYGDTLCGMQRDSNTQAQRRCWLGNGGSAGKILIQGLEYELALVVEKSGKLPSYKRFIISFNLEHVISTLAFHPVVRNS